MKFKMYLIAAVLLVLPVAPVHAVGGDRVSPPSPYTRPSVPVPSAHRARLLDEESGGGVVGGGGGTVSAGGTTGAVTNFAASVTASQSDAGAVVAGTGLLLIGIMLTFRFFKWVMGSIGGAVKR